MAELQDENGHTIYQIKIKGHLDRKWLDRFYGMSMTHECDGTTTLQRPLPDQTRIVCKTVWIRDKNLRLISVNPAASTLEDDQGLV
jgi:hypothetical protein